MPIPFQIFFTCEQAGVGTATLPISMPMLRTALEGYKLDPDFFIIQYIHYTSIAGGNTFTAHLRVTLGSKVDDIIYLTGATHGQIELKYIVDDSMPFTDYATGISIDTRQPINPSTLSIIVNVTVGAGTSTMRGIAVGELWLKGEQ